MESKTACGLRLRRFTNSLEWVRDRKPGCALCGRCKGRLEERKRPLIRRPRLAPAMPAWAAKSRLRRSLRVSRPITGSGILATLTSGRGSFRGSRFSAGWSSIPDREQTMQQKTDPGRISPRCGQTDWGVNGPIGKRGTKRGSWGASPDAPPESRIRKTSRSRKRPVRDDTSRARARAAPC